MKNIILVLLVVLCCRLGFAQDTSIIKYLPLQVGNVWVYRCTGSPASDSGKSRIRITATTISNGHTFYQLVLTGHTCNCSFESQSPFLDALVPMRIDSLTGNIMFQSGSCAWHVNEHIEDSLKLRQGNTIFDSCYFGSCSDTNQQTVFGVLRNTKYLGSPVYQNSKLRRYAYGIGLVSSLYGCYYNTGVTYTLLGCVIDGVVYGDTSILTGVNMIASEVPKSFTLYQNYPNPFNPLPE